MPLSARLLGVGVRGARTVTKATGIDRAVEVAAEEAIVAAVESEAVERAMARVLEGPVVEEAVEGALESEAVKKALLEAMDSELVDEVWRRLLASDQAQQLVERIAEAPEVRAAISAQGAGLLEDIGRTIGNLARRLDDRFERIVRRIFFRRAAGAADRPRRGGQPRPGDGRSTASSSTSPSPPSSPWSPWSSTPSAATAKAARGFAIAVGSTAWLSFGAIYLLGFWSLAGQTPGMRFVGIRLERGAAARCGAAIRRLIGLGLAVLTFGIGFLGDRLRRAAAAPGTTASPAPRSSTTSGGRSRRPGRAAGSRWSV